MSYKVLSQRNKIFNFELKDTEYVELIRFKDGNMAKVKDAVALRDILIMLNGLKGNEKTLSAEEHSTKEFINIYDKTFKKTEIAVGGSFLSVNGRWYRLDTKSEENFKRVFEKYTKSALSK